MSLIILCSLCSTKQPRVDRVFSADSTTGDKDLAETDTQSTRTTQPVADSMATCVPKNRAVSVSFGNQSVPFSCDCDCDWPRVVAVDWLALCWLWHLLPLCCCCSSSCSFFAYLGSLSLSPRHIARKARLSLPNSLWRQALLA